MISLEQLFQTKIKTRNNTEFIPDFRVAVQSPKDGMVHVLIHPFGYKGEAVHYLIKENEAKPFGGI